MHAHQINNLSTVIPPYFVRDAHTDSKEVMFVKCDAQ